MKIIVSSRTIASRLKKLNLSENWVTEISVVKGGLCFTNNISKCEIVPCEINESNTVITDIDARWDWLQKTLSMVVEQPVMIEIFRNKIILKIEY